MLKRWQLWKHGRCRCHSLEISLLLPSTDEKPWSAVRAGYHILRSPVFSSLEPLGNWPTYSHSTLDLQSSMIDIWQRVEIFNLKSWPVFTPGSSNLNAISVSLSQSVSSLQSSPGFISACSAYPWTLPETESAFSPQSAGGSCFFLIWSEVWWFLKDLPWCLSMFSYHLVCTSKASSLSCSLSFFFFFWVGRITDICWPMFGCFEAASLNDKTVYLVIKASASFFLVSGKMACVLFSA